MKLIELDSALKGLENLNAISFYEANEHSKEAYMETKDMLKALPTVDAVIVKHGLWKCSDKYENAVCSVCGYDTGEAYGFGYGNGCYNFCPMCGADMRRKAWTKKVAIMTEPTEKQVMYAKYLAQRMYQELPKEYTKKAYSDFIEKWKPIVKHEDDGMNEPNAWQAQYM